jgi:hypothetical protein
MGESERIRRTARRAATALPISFTVLALGIALTRPDLLHSLLSPLHGHGPQDIALGSSCVCVIVIAIVTSIALRRATSDRPPTPAALVSAPLVPWVLGLAAMTARFEHSVEVIATVDASSARPMWVRAVYEALGVLFTGTSASAALLGASVVVLGILWRAETVPRRVELRASTALAALACGGSLAVAITTDIERTTYRPFRPAPDDPASMRIALAGVTSLDTAEIALVVVGLVLAVVFVFALRAAWGVDLRTRIAWSSAIGCVVVVAVVDVAVGGAIEREATRGLAPPWAVLEGFVPLSMQAPTFYVGAPALRQTLVDRDGIHDPDDPRAVLAPTQIAQRWIDDAALRPSEYIEEAPYEWDEGREAGRIDPACPIDPQRAHVYVAAARDLSTTALLALGAPARDANRPTIELLGVHPTTIDPAVSRALPMLAAYLAYAPRTLVLPVPSPCAPSSDHALTIVARIEHEGTRLAWYATDEPINAWEDVEARHARRPNGRPLVLLVPSEGLRVQQLVDAIAWIQSGGDALADADLALLDAAPRVL